MRSFALPLILLALTATGRLEAQMVMRQSMGAPAPATLERLIQNLSRTRQGTLVVIDAQGTLRDALRALLEKDPLVELVVPLQTFEPDKGVGKELREREGWNETPRWAYLDVKGAVRQTATELPSASGMADQLMAAGFPDRTAELETYLRKHPDQVEALYALLRHRFAIARNRMRAHLKFPDPPKGNNPEDRAAARLVMPELVRPLTDAEDRLIWGMASDVLDRMMRQEGWQLALVGSSFLAGLTTGFPVEARHSPLMKAVCSKHLPKVEEALLRAPSNDQLWQTWVRMAGCTGRGNLRELCASVVQAPSAQKRPLPPDSILGDFVMECRLAKDWRGLAEAMQPRFDAARERAKDATYTKMMANFGGGMANSSWDNAISPYLEGLLMQGRTAQAESVVNEVLTWPGAKELPAAAASVALRCGQDELAKRWAALTPAEKQ